MLKELYYRGRPGAVPAFALSGPEAFAFIRKYSAVDHSEDKCAFLFQADAPERFRRKRHIFSDAGRSMRMPMQPCAAIFTANPARYRANFQERS